MPLPGPTFELGEDTTCVAGSAMECFGSNNFGQCGNGTTSALVDFPAAAPAIADATYVDVGPRHSCAIADGRLSCWGDNGVGQLGQSGMGTRTAPVAVDIADPIVGVALGTDHTCAWSAMTLYCWGSNVEGQLGDGGLSSRAMPMPTADLGGQPIHAAAGGAHTCAVRNDGTVLCWGTNDDGESDPESPGIVAVAVPTMVAVRPAIQLAVGTQHSCALHRDGTVSCWGADASGQLGDLAMRARGLATDVLADATMITAVQRHTCALTTSGEVRCWGVPPVSIQRDTPTPFTFSGAAIEVRTGGQFTCVRLTSGDAECRGRNSSHQFGVTAPSSSMGAVAVPW